MTAKTQLPINEVYLGNFSRTKSFENNTFDFFYVLNGNITITQQNNTLQYQSGQLTLRFPNTLYDYCGNGENNTIHISIDADFFYDNLGLPLYISIDSALQPENPYTEIKHILLEISSLYLEDSRENSTRIMGLLYFLLHCMKDCIFHTQSTDNKKQPASERSSARKLAIIDYLNQNFQEPLSLSDVAAHFFVSASRFSSFFHQSFSVSFSQYLTELRLFEAAKNIKYSNKPILEIALSNGFESAGSFIRNFKKYYGMTPIEYRSKNRVTKTNLNPDINNASDIDITSELISRDIKIDTLDIEATEISNICELINIGNVQNLLSRSFLKLLLNANKDLKFTYVRIQEVISNAFIPMILPDYNYFFHNVETVFSFLFENNMIPFIELSRYSVPYKNDSYIPSIFLHRERFYKLFEGFLSYCCTRWPMSWLSQWKFEFWYCNRVSINDYIETFKHLKLLLEKYIPHASLGGPGHNEFDSSNQMTDFLKAWKNNGIAPDFISIYLGMYTLGDQKFDDEMDSLSKRGNPSLLSSDPDYPIKKCAATQKLLNKFLPSVPLYITEWTSAFFDNLPLPYSTFQAAYITKIAPKLKQFSELNGYWLFCDDFQHVSSRSELKDFWGNGIIGRNGQKYPSYYSFQCLNNCGTKLLFSGKDYYVFQNDIDEYSIITFNYAHINPAFANQIEQNFSFDMINNVFNSVPAVNVKVNLSSLKDGQYQITHYLLDEAHGNFLGDLVEGYSRGNVPSNIYLPELTNTLDSSIISSSMFPSQIRYFINVDTENSLTLTETLKPNSICMWKICKMM